jgi:hypothetical protein
VHFSSNYAKVQFEEKRMHGNDKQAVATTVRALAEQYNVAYVTTSTDVWAHNVTRLAGDDVKLDEVELLLIALQRSGHLSRPDALALQVRYLREAKP